MVQGSRSARLGFGRVLKWEDTGRWRTLYRIARAISRGFDIAPTCIAFACMARLQIARRNLLGNDFSGSSRKARKRHRAPWLLATSLRHEPGSSRRIAHRMQIEEGFTPRAIATVFGAMLAARTSYCALWRLVPARGHVRASLDWARRLQAILPRSALSSCDAPFALQIQSPSRPARPPNPTGRVPMIFAGISQGPATRQNTPPRGLVQLPERPCLIFFINAGKHTYPDRRLRSRCAMDKLRQMA